MTLKESIQSIITTGLESKKNPEAIAAIVLEDLGGELGYGMASRTKQLAPLIAVGQANGKSNEFIARAFLFFVEWHLNFSLYGNGWLDDDEDTIEEISMDSSKIFWYLRFLKDCGIVAWYNKDVTTLEAYLAQKEEMLNGGC